jgi:hypothetical protein
MGAYETRLQNKLNRMDKNFNTTYTTVFVYDDKNDYVYYTLTCPVSKLNIIRKIVRQSGLGNKTTVQKLLPRIGAKAVFCKFLLIVCRKDLYQIL